MSESFALGRRLGGNALAKLGSELVGRVATFGLSLLIANRLGEQAFGAYSYGLALGFVLAQIADLGLQVLAARDIAIAGRAAQPLVAGALRLKLWLALPVVALLVLLRNGRAPTEQAGLLLLGLAMLAQTFLEFAAYIYRGQQRVIREAWLLTAARLLTAFLAAAALLAGGGLLEVGWAYLVAISAVAVWALRRLDGAGWFQRTAGILPANSGQDTRSPGYSAMLRQALPLGIAIFLSIAYTRVAVFLLEFRLGAVAVAQFSAAQRLVEPAQIVPAALLAAVFPAFSQAMHSVRAGERRQAHRLALGSSLLLALAGAGVALFFWFAAPWLIPTLYGEPFVESVPVLRLLGLSALPAFINYNLTHILIARGQQLYSSLFVGLMLAIHSALSWVFIPILGAVAPAISVTFAELLLLLCCTATLFLTRGSESRTAVSGTSNQPV